MLLLLSARLIDWREIMMIQSGLMAAQSSFIVTGLLSSSYIRCAQAKREQIVQSSERRMTASQLPASHFRTPAALSWLHAWRRAKLAGRCMQPAGNLRAREARCSCRCDQSRSN